MLHVESSRVQMTTGATLYKFAVFLAVDCKSGSVAISAGWKGHPMKFDPTKMTEALNRVVQRMHYPLEVMLVCVRWYAAYPLSFRNIEEMMAERGVFVDHSTLHRWSMKILPVLAAAFRRRKRPVGLSWRMEETYVKVAVQRKYLNNLVEQDHRAVKRITRPTLGFKTFRCARILIVGNEVMHMIRKGQLGDIKDRASSPANQFYSLAFCPRLVARLHSPTPPYRDRTSDPTASLRRPKPKLTQSAEQLRSGCPPLAQRQDALLLGV